MKKNESKGKESMLIDWLLVLLYFAVVGGLCLALKARSDFLMQYGIPGILILTVSCIFGVYLKSLFGINGERKDEN